MLTMLAKIFFRSFRPMPVAIPPQPWGTDSAGLNGPASILRVIPGNNEICWMSWPERMLVYSTIYALRPKRCLEIGTFQGGSTAWIVAALDDLGEGRLVCVDPNPRVAPENWDRISHRATMIAGPSPEAVADAARAARGKFDWALIDGEYRYSNLVNDLEATLPTLADEAYILFHDAYYHEVEQGLKDMFAKHRQLTDLGMISRTSTTVEGVRWGGIRMARFNR